MDRAEPYRADLSKARATYYVIADDEGAYSGNSWRYKDREPERDVLEVQRAAADSVERELQREGLSQAVIDSQSPLKFLTVEAVSHADAASLVRRQFAEERKFEVLADVFYADELAFGGAGFGDAAS